jgi:putative transposase
MPRQARLVIPGYAMHVIQRGNDRKTCFRSHRDYLVYLVLLRDCSVEAGCLIHAYCLMPNHVHLLLTPRGIDSCAAQMHGVSQRYAAYFNRRYDRTGTLWEGRFKSCLVDSAEYMLACHRYIEMNPVRAGLVTTPAEYSWSSFQGNAGLRKDSILTAHPERERLSTETYVDLFGETLTNTLLMDIRNAANSGCPLGSQTFKEVIERSTGRRVEKLKPGPKKAPSRGSESSVAVPDLFSGGGVS